jgi:hypothetical protein
MEKNKSLVPHKSIKDLKQNNSCKSLKINDFKITAKLGLYMTIGNLITTNFPSSREIFSEKHGRREIKGMLLTETEEEALKKQGFCRFKARFIKMALYVGMTPVEIADYARGWYGYSLPNIRRYANAIILLQTPYPTSKRSIVFEFNQ